MAKVRFSHILEYSVHCITLVKERGNSVVTLLHYHKLMSHVYPVNTFFHNCRLVTYHGNKNNQKGMFLVEWVFVGRDEVQAPLKRPAWEAIMYEPQKGGKVQNFHMPAVFVTVYLMQIGFSQ